MARLFSSEDAAGVVATLAQRHAGHTRHERFEIDGRVEAAFVELSAALVREDGTFRYDIEVRVPLGAPAAALGALAGEERRSGPTQAEAREIAIDFLGYYLDLYFEGGRDLLLPLDFQPYELGNQSVWARGDLSNPKLDRLADEILEAGGPLAPEDPRHKLKIR